MAKMNFFQFNAAVLAMFALCGCSGYHESQNANLNHTRQSLTSEFENAHKLSQDAIADIGTVFSCDAFTLLSDSSDLSGLGYSYFIAIQKNGSSFKVSTLFDESIELVGNVDAKSLVGTGNNLPLHGVAVRENNEKELVIELSVKPQTSAELEKYRNALPSAVPYLANKGYVAKGMMKCKVNQNFRKKDIKKQPVEPKTENKLVKAIRPGRYARLGGGCDIDLYVSGEKVFFTYIPTDNLEGCNGETLIFDCSNEYIGCQHKSLFPAIDSAVYKTLRPVQKDVFAVETKTIDRYRRGSLVRTYTSMYRMVTPH